MRTPEVLEKIQKNRQIEKLNTLSWFSRFRLISITFPLLLIVFQKLSRHHDFPNTLWLPVCLAALCSRHCIVLCPPWKSRFSETCNHFKICDFLVKHSSMQWLEHDLMRKLWFPGSKQTNITTWRKTWIQFVPKKAWARPYGQCTVYGAWAEGLWEDFWRPSKAFKSLL